MNSRQPLMQMIQGGKTDKEPSSIVRAINDAEEVKDPLVSLVERSATDPGAPFEPDAIKMLAKLKQTNSPEYERARADFQKTDVRIGPLEKEVADAIKRDPSSQTQSMNLPQIEPWPDPVDGADLLNEIVAAVKSYLAIDTKYAQAITLWIVHSHALDCAQISPRLAFSSPEKRCGKTTAMSVVGRLVQRRLHSANVTPAVIFRVIEMANPTLLIDEADTFLGDNNELRGVVNSGHNRETAYVLRTVGDDYVPKGFRTWGPMVIALIGDLPGTIADRSIIIKMRRKRRDEIVERFRSDRVSQLDELGRKIARWVHDNAQKLKSWDDDAPAELNDRAADNWRPLLAIADVAGGDWPTVARRVAIDLSEDSDDETAGVKLLGDLRDLFEEASSEQLATTKIIKELAEKEDRPWKEWRQGREITAQQLSKLLKPFGIAPGTIRVSGKKTAKGYQRSRFGDAFDRYLTAQPVTPSQPAEILGFGAPESVTPDDLVTAIYEQERSNTNACDVVTDQQADEWDETI
jgi:hypothetical protein